MDQKYLAQLLMQNYYCMASSAKQQMMI